MVGTGPETFERSGRPIHNRAPVAYSRRVRSTGSTRGVPSMQIEVKGRNLPVTDELRECVTRRFEKVGKQVSELAVLEVELFEERNPANPDSQVAEATLHLKGVTLRAQESSRDLKHSINLISDELARQVKRHRDKRRKRREQRAGAGQVPPQAAEPDLGAPGTLPAV